MDQLDDVADLHAKPFLEHLDDLRQTLVRCAMVFGAAFLISLPFTPWFLGMLKRPLHALVDDPDTFLPSMEVVGAFAVTMRVALWCGLIISAPFLIFFIGHFVAPGLTEKERRIVGRCMGFAVVLFIAGVLLGYFITLPVALEMMFRWHTWLGIRPLWTINSYVAFSSQLLIAFGLAFEMPVVVLILGRFGIVSSTMLRDKRRHIIIGLLVLAMLLTPPDVVTQLIMAIPLILLCELCIWLLWMSERRDADGETDN